MSSSISFETITGIGTDCMGLPISSVVHDVMLNSMQVYSPISQRENAMSLRDNDELKKISTNQGRVALAASRDSAAMRVIAVITIVFLPATFTAVSIMETTRIYMRPVQLTSSRLCLVPPSSTSKADTKGLRCPGGSGYTLWQQSAFPRLSLHAGISRPIVSSRKSTLYWEMKMQKRCDEVLFTPSWLV